MSWYYSKNGTQLGPVETEELLGKYKSGEVSSTDLVWKEGMSDWKQAGQLPELGGSASMVSVPPSISESNVSLAQPSAMPSGQLQYIPNYLWQSIVATILCCMPFGVVGIVFAAKVDGLVARGDLAGARAASQSAKTWTMVAVGCGLVAVVLWILLVALSAANS